MRKLPTTERGRVAALLCILLTTDSCTVQSKKVAPAPPPLLPEQPVAVQLPPAPTYEGPVRLYEVRLMETAGQHQVRFRLSRPPEGIDYFPLRNPSRLVVDIKGTIETPPKVQRYKASDPLISAVRVGNYQGRMRLVVDLKGRETPAFSVENTDTAVAVQIGEKSEKAEGKALAEAKAQVLFLADEGKLAVATSKTTTSQPEGRRTEAAAENPALFASGPTVITAAPQEESTTAKLEMEKGGGAPASTEPVPTDLTKSATPSTPLREETFGSAIAPSSPATHSAEEDAWGMERVTQIPPSFAAKLQKRGQRKAGQADSTTLALEENAAAFATEFKPEHELQYTGKKISLDFKNADLHDVFRIIAEVSGLNIVATDDVKARVTLRLVEVPWDQALDVVLQSNGLEKTQTGNVITVSTTKRLEAERNARLAARNAEQKITPLVTEYIKVNYVKATKVVELMTREVQQRVGTAGGAPGSPLAGGTPPTGGAISGVGGPGGTGSPGGIKIQQVALLSPRGTITADSVSNIIAVRDIPDNIALIREFIKNIDIQTPQVVIESYLVTTNENLNRNLGIQWGYSRTPGTDLSGRVGLTGSGLTTGTTGVPFVADFPASGVIPGSGSALDILLGSALGGEALDIRLSALEREGKARVISRPRVVTINNQKADIRSRRVVRVPIVSGSLNVGGAGSTQGGGNAFQEFEVGIILNVTPQISSDGFILLNIDAETSDLTDASVKPTGSGSSFPLIPDTLTRTASSNVLIHSGETFVLGGILQDDVERQKTGVPYFRDIPVLGWMFRGENKNRIKSELLVFVTPKVVMGGATGPLPTSQQLWENREKKASAENIIESTLHP